MNERVVLVTGASDGLGKSLVKELCAAGASVAFCGRSQAKLDEVKADALNLTANIYCEAFDIRDRGLVSNFVKGACTRFGRIDVLVNNAGVMYLAPVMDMGASDVDEMVDVNLKAPIHFIDEVLPIFRTQKSGDILNISSISARIVGPGVVAYSSTKLALDNYTEGLRRELGPLGIRVMSLNLGAVATDLNDKIKHDGMRKIIKMRQKSFTAMHIAEVVEAIKYMLSRERSVCTANLFLVPSAQAL